MIVLDYIKNEKWFQGVRAETSLLMFSLKVKGQRDLMKGAYGIEFVECLLCPTKKNNFIRIFNLTQAKEFHAHSLKKLSVDQNIIKHFLEKDKVLWKEISKIINVLNKTKEKKTARKLFIELCENYKEYGLHFFVIFSLGMKLAEINGNKTLIIAHDHWRNSVTFDEEKFGEAVWQFFDLYYDGIKPLDIMTYLSYEELLEVFDEPEKIRKIIEKRKRNDYLYLGLRKSSRVIDNVKTIKDVGEHFNKLFEEKIIKDLIQGRVTYQSDEVVNGEVVLVESKEDLKGNYKGKILVSVQTTPHFVPYLDGVKAIITDEGGVTSHAAIISREFKIPAVIGTQIATKVLKTGDIVEIIFKEGKVRKVK
jgi:phosphoenolpyruvate synthase/pyruvate phosphate dikinase